MILGTCPLLGQALPYAWDMPALGTGPSIYSRNTLDRPAFGTCPSVCLGQAHSWDMPFLVSLSCIFLRHAKASGPRRHCMSGTIAPSAEHASTNPHMGCRVVALLFWKVCTIVSAFIDINVQNTQIKHVVRMCLDRPLLLSITLVDVLQHTNIYIYCSCSFAMTLN